MVEINNVSKEVDAFIASLSKSKKFEDAGIQKMSASPQEVPVRSTGSMVLDNALGGGFARGRLIEIYGPESSGKTTIALTAIAKAQEQGENCFFIDMENALDMKYAKTLGVREDLLHIAQPESAEMAMDLLKTIVESGLFGIATIDSVASMVPQAELEGDAEDVTVGLLARIMSKELRKVIGPANKGEIKTTVLLINQTRDKIGGFSPMGTPQTTPGGQAPKFYATQRVSVKRSFIKEREGDKDSRASAAELKFEVVKNKIAPPGAKVATLIRYGEGIDVATEIIGAGPAMGIIDRPTPRKWVEVETGEEIGNSKDEALSRIKEDKALRDRLLAAALKATRSGKVLDEKDIDLKNVDLGDYAPQKEDN